MNKILSLIICTLICVLQTVQAQNKSIYFDKKGKKTDTSSKAKYSAYRFDTTANAPYNVVYSDDFTTAYAKGDVFPADTLTFDGKVSFVGNGEFQTVRYYDKGRPLPFVFVDKTLKKGNPLSIYYMAVGTDGEFFVYERTSAKIKMTDKLCAKGHVTDTTSLTFDGLVTIYPEEGQPVTTKYKRGVVIPFIQSTTDIQEPYERIELVTFTFRANAAENVQDAYEKFINQCRNSGADGVIGVKTDIYHDPYQLVAFYRYSVLIQGTTIRLKNQ